MSEAELSERTRHALTGTVLAPSDPLPRTYVPTTPAEHNWAECGPTHRTEFGMVLVLGA